MSTTAFIKKSEGLYDAPKAFVSADDIITQAQDILREGVQSGQPITDPKAAVDFLQMSLANEDNEHFAALFMNTRNVVIAFERLFSGSVDQSAVYPRVVVQRALALNASAVIFAHNHPSGDCEPSRSDKRITKDLVDALGLINVRVLDHFVVSQANWVSLAEQGWL